MPKGYFKSTGNPLLDDGLAEMLPQVMLAMVVQAGGYVTLKVKDVDSTGKYIMMMEIFDDDNGEKCFRFKTERKS
jgi:hypothetical protein